MIVKTKVGVVNNQITTHLILERLLLQAASFLLRIITYLKTSLLGKQNPQKIRKINYLLYEI